MKLILFISFLISTLFISSQVISSGYRHSSFICADGTVKTTGLNSYGALGHGDTLSLNIPSQISNLNDVIGLATGCYHTIFLKSNGKVYGTGYNGAGQLGDNTMNDKLSPILIESLIGIVDISCGLHHSVFLRNDGQVLATGFNGYGQIGFGNSGNMYTSPVQPLITDVKDIDCGMAYSLFLKEDGTVWGTGENTSYQLGLGDTLNRETPTQINGLNNIIAIAGGGGHSLFLKNDGTVYACGRNISGQLGMGDNVLRTTPVLIPDLDSIIYIAAGANFSMFVKSDGTVYSCGANVSGQLGVGDNNDRNLPTLIVGLTNIKSLELGLEQAFFIREDLKVLSCGKNIYGELGNGDNLSTNVVEENTNLCAIFNTDKKVIGKVYYDLSEDCIENNNETGISSVKLLIQPINLLVETNSSGFWSLDSLPEGDYIISIDSNSFETSCNNTYFFTVENSDSLTIAPSFGMFENNPCTAPSISINMPFIRPCFTNQQIYLQACNEYDATTYIPDAFTILDLDSNLIFENASIPFTSLGQYKYRFQHDTLYPGQCVNFTISVQVDCDVTLGQTLCMEANLYPVDDCSLDSIPTPPTGEVTPCTLPWDHSSLSVEGWCANDSIYFTITNTGDLGGGDMLCYSPVRIYIDGVPYLLDSVQLLGGETVTYSFLGTGETWILQADQHPLHPGNSHPNAHVENCNPGNWTINLVNDFPQDDADPVVDVYCGIVTGSYDPNDKKGLPNGLGTEHHILPNQDLEYIIRFQNTGTDTAFTVVVRDTLDLDFDIFSVTPGVSSHNYSFRMYGPRILEWTFANILLPDSTTNEPASNGFLTFSVKQKPNLPDGTLFLNEADIYFDFNEPIITNETNHKVQRQIFEINGVEKIGKNQLSATLFPNPTNGSTVLSFSKYTSNFTYSLLDASGRALFQKSNQQGKQVIIDMNNFPKGIYFVKIENTDSNTVLKLIVD